MTILTPQERRVLLFLIASVLIGTGVTIYKGHNPSFAPEIEREPVEKRSEPSSLEPGIPSKININTASRKELESLPGIGPVYAERIVADRRERGPFRAKEDLMRVKGIGATRYRALETQICVE